MAKKLSLIFLNLFFILLFTINISANIHLLPDTEISAPDSGIELPVDNDGNIEIDYFVTDSDANSIKIWGPGYYRFTNDLNGTISVSNLQDGEYTFWAETYTGEVTIVVEGIEHTIDGEQFNIEVDVEDSQITADGGTTIDPEFHDHATNVTVGEYDMIITDGSIELPQDLVLL
ncbi:MAG: hypothetical protein ACQESP_11240, partial [Candidatus Muiribacteriota bacterium]